ncbi:MAG: aminodeoxychorismate/anthranilate synthase component II [Bacteroidetes bacterium]|nr:aminodeoxychorismate/anthranilate synthase component II [Bacteroidota bacterium]
MRLLLLDNYDSFTYNLYDYLTRAGAECLVLRNDALEEKDFQNMDFQAIVLSPGPKRPENAGVLMNLLAHFCNRKPILGVCLGMQAIGLQFGVPLLHAPAPKHGKTSRIHHVDHPMFDGLPDQFSVMRYHSLALGKLDNSPLRPLAFADDGVLMALTHENLPIWGMQFHPESILTEFGLEMIQNWVSFARQFI